VTDVILLADSEGYPNFRAMCLIQISCKSVFWSQSAGIPRGYANHYAIARAHL